MIKEFYFKQFSVALVICLHSFLVSNSSIWSIDRTLSGATTLGQSGPGSNVNEVVLHIPQSSSIIGSSPSDCLVLYPGHLLVGSLLLCRDAISVLNRCSWLGFEQVDGVDILSIYRINIFGYGFSLANMPYWFLYKLCFSI